MPMKDKTKTIHKELTNYSLLNACGYYYPVDYCYTDDFKSCNK